MNNRERIAKEQENIDYIDEHVANVQKAFQSMFLDRKDEIVRKYSDSDALEDAIEMVSTKIEQHDYSKYSDEEFEGYRRRFFPTQEEKSDEEQVEIAKEMFAKAWEHHYLNNDHHPNYWLDENGKPTDMELHAIVHMLADWGGMGIKFGGDPKQYYYEDAEEEKSMMTEQTKRIVEELLSILYPA